MARLKVIMIDVGWGDSIFLETEYANGRIKYGLIDSNDTATLRSSYIYLKRYFEKAEIDIADSKPLFDFILLSHAHSDHGQGLKALMKEFGTKEFWYPKSLSWGSCADLIGFAGKSTNVGHQEALDDSKILPSFGDVKMSVLWPHRDPADPDAGINRDDENNNSVILRLELNQVSFMLTGDAEADVWHTVAPMIPANTEFFKVPHHGSVNGSLESDKVTPTWLNNCPAAAKLGISSHIRPHTHPDAEVIQLFEGNHREYYRTDLHYHASFETCGQAGDTVVRYFH